MEEYTFFIVILFVIGVDTTIWGVLTVFHHPFYDWADKTFWKDDSGLFDEKSRRQYNLSWGWRWIIMGLMLVGITSFWLFFN